ncbi:MAG: hypothetical protein KDK65_07985, partial [Chlamydiia bacterium]|nr:hypothetical protein [Chlamydiia bacterium]
MSRICPKAELIQATATELGFLCEFTYDKILSETSLDALEEVFRGLCAENLPLQAREMVAENAAVFLKAKNFPL